MHFRWFHQKSLQRGITLIELLAVLVIVGILAAIAIPSIGQVLAGSKEKADRATEQMLFESSLRYMTDYELGAKALVDQDQIYISSAFLIEKGYLSQTPRNQTNRKTYLFIAMKKNSNAWAVDPTMTEPARTYTSPEASGAQPPYVFKSMTESVSFPSTIVPGDNDNVMSGFFTD